MKLEDKRAFADKMKEISRVVQRQIYDEDIDAYFNQFEDYPIKLMTKALDLALDNRDPQDIYLATVLPNHSEIKSAIIELTRSADEGEAGGTVSSCPLCNGTGWKASEGASGRFLAWPCKCLYEIAREALKIKGKSGSTRSCNGRIVAAYEYHQRHWGGEEK